MNKHIKMAAIFSHLYYTTYD